MQRQLATVFTFSATAQLAAFAKSILIAYYFGIGAALDGYYLGQAFPAVISGILVGVLQTGFSTIYAGRLALGQHRGAEALLGSTLFWFAAIGLIASIAISVASPSLIATFAVNTDSPVAESAIASLRILAFLLFINVLADCLSLALHAHGSFAIAAFAPTANVVVASALLVSFPDWGLGNLVWGTLLGLLVQLLLIAAEIRRRKIGLRFNGLGDVKLVVYASAAILPGLLFANVSLLVPQVIAAELGEGVVAAFSMAMRLYGAATQVLAMTLSAVLLPYFARAVGVKEYASVAMQLYQGFPLVALISVAATLWVGLVGEALISLLFERGAFDTSASIAVSTTWFWLTVGLLPFVWGVVVAKVLLALRLAGAMSVVAFFSLASSVILTSLLADFAGLPGIAIAVGITSLGSTVACNVLARRQLSRALGKPLPKPSWNGHRTLAVATATLTILAFLTDWLFSSMPDPARIFGVSISVAGATTLGIRNLIQATRSPHSF